MTSKDLAETEVPLLAFQSRLAQTFYALKAEFVDRSIDKGILERDASFTQQKPRTTLPFQSKLSLLKSHMKGSKSPPYPKVSY